MVNFFFLGFLLLSIPTWADVDSSSTATFTIDSRWATGTDKTELAAMEWVVQGKGIKLGDPALQARPTNNAMDTIFYRRKPNHKVDTILCKIVAGQNYLILYNACCGGFNIKNTTVNEYPLASVGFSCTHPSQLMMGTVGESSMLFKQRSPVFFSWECRSAMASNVTYITLSSGQKQSNGCDQDELYCLLNDEGKWEPEESEPGFCFQPTQVFARFLYIALQPEKLQVRLDSKSGKYQLSVL